MTYEVMDCTNMSSIPDNFYDVAVDKSTIDALLCGDNAYLMVAKMTKEIQRVIKPDTGLYIAISYGKPESRFGHFERPHLKFANKQFVLYPAEYESGEAKEEKSHYIYVCRKLAGADQQANEKWDEVVAQLKKEAEREALLHAGDSDNEDDDDEIQEKKNKKKAIKGIHFRSLS